MAVNNKRAALVLGVIVSVALLGHYLHFDDRLVQLAKEQRSTPTQRTASLWLNGYEAVIQGKRIERLKKAETSGLAWHAATNTLFTITGKLPKLAQLSLTGELIREIDLLGVADTEGVAVLSDGRFAVVDERRGTLSIFSLPVENHIDLSRKGLQFKLDELAPELMIPDNKGLEGVAWDAANNRFILAKERDPHALYALAFDLQSNRIGALTELPAGNLFMRDISGLSYDLRTGHLLVLSDDSSMLLELDQHFEPVSFMSFFRGFNGLDKGIKQAEGVTMDAQGNIYVVGEPNVFYRFSKPVDEAKALGREDRSPPRED